MPTASIDNSEIQDRTRQNSQSVPEEKGVVGQRDALNDKYKQIPLAGVQEGYKLSSAQRRLWILCGLPEASLAYHVPNTMMIEDCDFEALEQAFVKTINRHEILRTIFKTNSQGEVRQWITSPGEVNFKIERVNLEQESQPMSRAAAWIDADSRNLFDLEKGPLLRATLFQLPNSKFLFYYNIHHIITDGWSMDILANDVRFFYIAFKTQQGGELPPLRIHYKDYASWQIEQLSGLSYATHESYWKQRLSGELPVLELPFQKHRPKLKTYNGRSVTSILPGAISKQLRKFCGENGGSLFMGLFTILNILIHKYTRQQEFIIGTPVAGRDHTDFEGQIGCYVNTIAVRSAVRQTDSFQSLFQKMKGSLLSDYAHQVYPFDKIVEDLNLKHDMSRSAIFDVMLALLAMNKSDRHEPAQPETALNYDAPTAKFDLTIVFKEFHSHLSLNVNYNTDLYDHCAIERLPAHFEQLTEGLLMSPGVAIKDVNFMPATETQQLLEIGKSAAAQDPGDKTFLDFLGENVLKFPHRKAVVCGDGFLTYQQLDEQATVVAKHLLSGGLKREDKVILYMDRGLAYFTSMIAVLKAGGCFIPVSPGNAFDRNSVILKAAPRPVVITTSAYRHEVENFHMQPTVFNYESMLEAKPVSDGDLPSVHASDLAYIIFTSGSTGVPKGAMIEHGGMVNHLLAKVADFSMDENSVVAQNATQTFDVSVWQSFAALMTGGVTVILLGDEAWEPQLLFHALSKHKVTLFESVPSHLFIILDFLQQVCPQLESLAFLMMNGEPLPVDYAQKWFHYYPSIPMANVYGPTECSDDITHFLFDRCSPSWNRYVPIGKAVRNMNLYLLDDELHLLPKGHAGELYASGKGVGRGYLNNAEQTTRCFIDNPFEANDGYGILYRTGDFARYFDDGTLEFIGRSDDQIKIRGNRVELGEIEHQVRSIENIKDAVVVLIETNTTGKALAAFMIASETEESAILKSHLGRKLPAYMIPDYFVYVNEFPLTAHGKIDRKALQAMMRLQLQEDVVMEEPTNAVETDLLLIWKDVLEKEAISLTQNFFDLGGNSLKAIQLMSRIGLKYGIRMNIQNIFNEPTIRKMALEITFLLRQDESATEDFVEIEI